MTNTVLSVNVNKIATLRNSRGQNTPNLIEVVKNIEKFGAQGITIHPRPDERHIKYQDARDLSKIVTTEYNIEGNPIPKFIELVCETKPTQVTLVPDATDAITSNAGWDTITHQSFLKEVIQEFKTNNIRCSIFVDPKPKFIEGALKCNADRIELYTENFAKKFKENKENSIRNYIETAQEAHKLGIGINAGHDLSLDNIDFFAQQIPHLKEVSIGHALICESLYLGLENVIQMYLRKLNKHLKQ